jgi:hypothetical protein
VLALPTLLPLLDVSVLYQVGGFIPDAGVRGPLVAELYEQFLPTPAGVLATQRRPARHGADPPPAHP